MATQLPTRFLGDTLYHLKTVWRDIANLRRSLPQLKLHPDLNQEDTSNLCQWIDSCLVNSGDLVAARARAAILAEAYLALSDTGRKRLLILLNDRYDIDRQKVETAIEHWRSATGPEQDKYRQSLRETLDPPRLKLLTQFNELPEGVKFLVDMRAELIALKRSETRLAALEADLKRLLMSWFDIGLLQLEEINWNSSAQLLEKLIAYEAVHAIQSWDDLKNRLASDRRCFAFFHPNMPAEPLIFVEVALVQGLADNVQALLDETAPIIEIQQADTAIFYSISNAQNGLAGISFGNFLIKRVVAVLQRDFPALKQFATLSPMPGFCRWLNQLDDTQLATLPGGASWLQLPQPRLPQDWHLDATLAHRRQQPLSQLAAHYLSQEKHRHHHHALDPVTRFHLSNGAQIKRLNWLADTSNKGLKESAGLMVNYIYDLSHIESNSQAYTEQGRIALSAQINSLLKQ
jgi:malonyl-CoA decarboxylase